MTNEKVETKPAAEPAVVPAPAAPSPAPLAAPAAPRAPEPRAPRGPAKILVGPWPGSPAPKRS